MILPSNKRLEELQRVFYSVVDEIYSAPENGTSWVAVIVHEAKDRSPIWPYSCLEAWRSLPSTLSKEIKKKRTTFEFLRKYFKLHYTDMDPFSEIIFSESGVHQPIIFTSTSYSSSVARVFSLDIMEKLANAFPEASEFDAHEWKDAILLKRVKKVVEELLSEHGDLLDGFIGKLKDQFGLGRKIDPSRLLHFLVWLFLHDPKGEFWIYLPCPRNMSQEAPWGGVIICQEKPPQDERIRIYQGLTELSFEICSYYREPSFEERRVIPFDEALSKASWVSDIFFLKYQRDIENGIWNFDIEKLRKQLIELEKISILKPLSWATFHERDIRWISAFGWHTYTNEPYRIGWDFCPGRPARNDREWKIVEKSRRRFKALADLFESLLKAKSIISIGDMLFTGCNRKRPIVISYDKQREELLSIKGYRNLEDRGDFVFATIFPFYSSFIDRLKRISVEELQTIDAEGFGQLIRTHLGSFEESTVSALDLDVFSQLLKLQPRINTEEEKYMFLKQMTLYLPWLILHDLETKLVVYFPSLIKQDVPSGGVMIGFKRAPSVMELISIQQHVTKLFAIRSYVLSELVPEFPDVLTEAPFIRKLETMFKEPKHGTPVSLAYIDLDNLKKINENYGGHTAGTLCIKVLTGSIKRRISEEVGVDRWAFARYGGDEFMLAVQNISCRKLENMIAKIREELKDKNKIRTLLDMELERYEGSHGKIKGFDQGKFAKIEQLTFSVGIASSSKHPTYIQLRQAADNAEDLAKKDKDKTVLCDCCV